MVEPERESQLVQAAEVCARAVYSFLFTCNAAAASLNQSLRQAQTAYGPLPMLDTIPLPLGLPPLPSEQLLATPVKEAPKSLSFPAMAADSHLWSPIALFQQQQQQQQQPSVPAGGATRSTGRAGQRRGSGHHSSPKLPPPMFGAAPQHWSLGGQPQPQQQHAPLNNSGGSWIAKAGSGTEHLPPSLMHWASEVSANMAALGTNAAVTAGLAPAGAGSPLSSPRAAALMAVCRDAEQGQQQQPQPPLVRLTSNVSSHYPACPLGGEATTAAMAAAVAGNAGGGLLAKQKSDLADLAQVAEQEFHAGAAVAPAEAAPAAKPAGAPPNSPGQQQGEEAPVQPASGSGSGSGSQEQHEDGLGAAQAQHSFAEPGAKRESEGEESRPDSMQPQTKRQRVGSNSPQLKPQPSPL